MGYIMGITINVKYFMFNIGGIDMDSKTLSKFHKFGNVGKVIMTVLMVITIIATIMCAVATGFVSSLPKDALTVRVTNNAEFRFNESNFQSLWGLLVDSLSYSVDSDPEEMLSEDGGMFTPPENQDFNAHISFFNQTYSSAKFHFDGNTRIMEAKSEPADYRSSDLVSVLIFLTLYLASGAVALFMLRRLFAVLAQCDSPFREDLIRKMKAFAFSLLPVAVFGTIGDTLSSAFLSAGKNIDIRIQGGIIIAFAVTMCLVTVFKYGVQLQKESDETL